MTRPKPKYFEYHCNKCGNLLHPMNHEYSRLKLDTSWRNYYCCECKRVMYTDYGWNYKKRKEIKYKE